MLITGQLALVRIGRADEVIPGQSMLGKSWILIEEALIVWWRADADAEKGRLPTRQEVYSPTSS
jgi:hypothetical protein